MRHSRGNVGHMHDAIQNALVHVLEAYGRKVRKEYEVPSLIMPGRSWVVDVADLTDRSHPIYYEIDEHMTPRLRDKIAAVAAHTNIDIQPILISEMDIDIRRSVTKLHKHLAKKVDGA